MFGKVQIKKGTNLYHFGYGPLVVEYIDTKDTRIYLYCRILDFGGVPYRLKYKVLQSDSYVQEKIRNLKGSSAANKVSESGITIDIGSGHGESGLTQDVKGVANESGLTADDGTDKTFHAKDSKHLPQENNADHYVIFDSRVIGHWVFMNDEQVLHEDFNFTLENVQPVHGKLNTYFSDMVHKKYAKKFKSINNYTVDEDGVIVYNDSDEESGITRDVSTFTGESMITADNKRKTKSESGLTTDNAKK